MSSSACKRLKLSDCIKWNAILPDEFLNTVFTLNTFMIADVKDNKKLSLLINLLQQVYPLTNQNKFKRVRKLESLDKSVMQVLLCPKETFKGLSNGLGDNLENLSEIDLPIDKILTRKQYDLVVKNHWPVNFHLDKYIESLLDKSFMQKNESLMLKHDFYSRLTLELAQFSKSTSAVLIVDPRSDTVVASGIDTRDSHPLAHSVLNAIKNVSKRQLKEFKSTHDDLDDVLNQFLRANSNKYELLEENFRKSLNKDDYLCTNYNIYMSHEPCSMCAMALVHSRVSKVFYLLNTKYGYLNSNLKLHCHKDLNHKYEAFEAVNFHLDSSFTNYFFDSSTKHVNFIKK